MANTQDIRRRIKSIRNTAQITKAMQMVAASKMRKAQQHALAGRPYAALMNKVFVSLQKRTDPRFHPLLAVRPLKKELVLIISTDKGLCGALNTNLFREASNFDQTKTAFVVTGKKARQFIARTKRELLADFELKDSPSFVEAKPISKFCMEKFLRREVDKVSVLYTHFINTINSARSYRHCYRSAVLICRKSTANRPRAQTKASIQCSVIFLNRMQREFST
jgi:F-type H+-transporting ATPase subunit gamma